MYIYIYMCCAIHLGMYAEYSGAGDESRDPPDNHRGDPLICRRSFSDKK